MAFSNVSPGRNVPHDVNAIVEIPMDADPVKYEVDKVSGAIFVDRVLSTPMRYPCNYGYMPQTLCGDGDPLDVLIVMPIPLIPGSVIACRPVGLMMMSDENGEDAKLIAVPGDQVFPAYQHIRDITDVPETTRARIQHFFEHYKDLEQGKWVRMEGWRNVDAAHDEIRRSIEAYASTRQD
ncbi:inorganic diphosphatase [Rhodanobacter sp. Si-c]|uniref:Inorganic pyrophosphatase n=1 Tax=Rhodanobacter lycopersici TaxID=3162487 RepID=A0ABV3Q998_9GAMM